MGKVFTNIGLLEDNTQRAYWEPTETFSIDSLKSKFRDYAKPNLFKIKINPPSVISGEWNDEEGILAKAASLPGVDIDNYVLERAGKTINVPSGKIENTPYSITFLNDVDNSLRVMFHRWQQAVIFNWEKSTIGLTKDIMDASVMVTQYDGQHKATYSVKLVNAWPKSISEIQLTQESENQIEEFSVDFVYTELVIYG